MEKIVKIILDNTSINKTGEATRLIVELIKAVEKPPEVRIVHDYTPYPYKIRNIYDLAAMLACVTYQPSNDTINGIHPTLCALVRIAPL